MKDLELNLRNTVDDSQITGIGYGDTVGPDDVERIEAAIATGIKVKGHYTDEVKVKVTPLDVWRYYIGDELIEDETGALVVEAEYGGDTVSIVLQWVNTPVDLDGDGK